MNAQLVRRTDILLRPDPQRVLIRFFAPGSSDRIERVISRVLTLDDQQVEEELNAVFTSFQARHKNLEEIFLKHYRNVRPYLISDLEPNNKKKLLIGAYFTSEYAVESAALFNPSIVEHPDQSDLKEGQLRFILSMRAIGEGHLSSIVFQTGVLDQNGDFTLDRISQHVHLPEVIWNTMFEKVRFAAKLAEMDRENNITREILSHLGETFTFEELKNRIERAKEYTIKQDRIFRETIKALFWLAESNYEIRFPENIPLSGRVIFPHSPTEQRGIEDARFVKFAGDDGQTEYFATYTANEGSSFLPQLLRTQNFAHFRFNTLVGRSVQNKGMALFPRKIKGRYVMLSRQDNENIFIMYSDHIFTWHEKKAVMKPSYTWEFIQLGNCGSPLETEEGWLVITHGVGPMRRYCIGAILLDHDDPSRIIGRLKKPLIEPLENEREGYVPNVVYSCGSLIHGNFVVIPYAMSDYATSFALVDLDSLLKLLKKA